MKPKSGSLNFQITLQMKWNLKTDLYFIEYSSVWRQLLILKIYLKFICKFLFEILVLN